jgi:DNA-binding response OmpR family regulator
MLKNSILIVDDDIEIRKLISVLLIQNGFVCSTAGNTVEAESILKLKNHHLMLLDIMLPGENGLSFCQRIHSQYKIPIIMISALNNEFEQILAHEYGADDYILKPFNTNLLIAKVKRALKRLSLENSDTDNYEYAESDQWKVNLTNRYLIKNGLRIDLSAIEYSLLYIFLQHPNKPFSRDNLMQKLHGKNCGVFDRSIDITISRLRKKIENDRSSPEVIKTLHNHGYLFTKKVTWS